MSNPTPIVMSSSDLDREVARWEIKLMTTELGSQEDAEAWWALGAGRCDGLASHDNQNSGLACHLWCLAHYLLNEGDIPPVQENALLFAEILTLEARWRASAMYANLDERTRLYVRLRADVFQAVAYALDHPAGQA